MKPRCSPSHGFAGAYVSCLDCLSPVGERLKHGSMEPPAVMHAVQHRAMTACTRHASLRDPPLLSRPRMDAFAGLGLHAAGCTVCGMVPRPAQAAALRCSPLADPTCAASGEPSAAILVAGGSGGVGPRTRSPHSYLASPVCVKAAWTLAAPAAPSTPAGPAPSLPSDSPLCCPPDSIDGASTVADAAATIGFHDGRPSHSCPLSVRAAPAAAASPLSCVRCAWAWAETRATWSGAPSWRTTS